MQLRKWIIIAFCMLLALTVYVSYPSLPDQQRVTLAVLFLAASLWFSEALPLFVTALIVPVALVVFGRFGPAVVFAPFFDPIIALLLGGLVIGRAIQKHGLDVKIARAFMSVFGNGPRAFLFGIMAATAFVSMWMSNTATAVLMLPIGIAVLSANRLMPGRSTYGKAVVMGIAYAATIGGIGTIVGTPPNAIAVKLLGDHGVGIGFTDWMVYAMPIMVAVLCLAWLVLSLIFRPEIKQIKPMRQKPGLTRDQKITLAIFAATVLLWVTESFHGIHYSVVAIMPVIALYLLEQLDASDISRISWDSLILVGGGLCLGVAIQASKLDITIAGVIGRLLVGLDPFLMLLVISLLGIAFTAFIANTAACAVLMPVMLPLAPALGLGTRQLGLTLGIVSSFDFTVPVGTPPNALAYSSGYVRVKDMVKVGLSLSLVSAIAISALAVAYW